MPFAARNKYWQALRATQSRRWRDSVRKPQRAGPSQRPRFDSNQSQMPPPVVIHTLEWLRM